MNVTQEKKVNSNKDKIHVQLLRFIALDFSNNF